MVSAKPAHSFVFTPWRSDPISVRIFCEATNMMLWPLQPEDRMQALVSLLAHHIDEIADNDEAIDALLDYVRLRVKYRQRMESPPLQNDQH